MMQTNSNLEVPRSEVQPQRLALNPKLLEAARTGDKDILDKLLRPKDVSSRASIWEFAVTMPDDSATQKDTCCLLGATLEGNTALHLVASRGHLELAKEICHRERSLLATKNTRLDTPLHCAARAGDNKMVSLIIQYAREGDMEARRVLTAQNRDDNNALHEAAKYDHAHVAKILMEEDAGLASMLNCVGMSPLYLAIMTGSFNVAKALLWSSTWENTSSSYMGPNKRTALHAVVRINKEITEAILQRKPTLAKGADYLGRIPLHYVAYSGDRSTAKLLLEHDRSTAKLLLEHDRSTAKLLLEHDRSTAYLSDADGFFPIHVAAMKGNIGVVDQILQQCPDTDELLDTEGKNFLHTAFKWKSLDLVRKIISKRPDLKKLLNEQDNEGNTPLHTAVKNSDQSSVHFLLRDKGVSPNIVNHDGFTPLNLACEKVNEEGLLCMLVNSLTTLNVFGRRDRNATWCILVCLAFTKALFGSSVKRVVSSSDEDKKKPSSDDDEVKENSSSSEETEMKKRQVEELKKELDVPKNLVIASVLIATVTFAAGLTAPGGYIADDHPGRGTIVLAKEYAFKVFFVSDASAFVCSILATTWFMYAGTSTVDKHTRRRALCFASQCLWMAFSGMSTAFAMGIYATLAHSCKSISILLCIIVLPTPLLAAAVSAYNFFSVLKTVGIRQGYRHCIWPTTIYPHVAKALCMPPAAAVYFSLLPISVAYAIFFLLPLL